MLDQTVDQSQKVSVEARQESLDAILKKAFAGKQISYEVVGKQIILKISRNSQSSQSRKISGTVKDQNGESVIGANVSVKGTTIGTITDIDGNFILEVPENVVIQISYIGYITQEISLGNKEHLDILLKEDLQSLDEIVVIGYGTAKRKDFTGSVSSVKLENSPISLATNTNALESLKGNVTGLDIGATNTAGGTPSMQIRGQNSISGSNDPLVVVDGVIFMGSVNDINPNDIASYDDSGVTGHKSCYVLEEGTYEIFAGSDVRSAKSAGIYKEELRVIEQLQEAYAPIEKFRRMKAVLRADGTYQAVTEEVPVRTADPHKRREERMPKTLEYTGDKGYKLADVLDKKVSMDEFVAQISEADLIAMFRGEGMCSPKVTAGTAAAFGGVTESLKALGIPVGCCADGPSGIRMDCGTKAFSLPNGTLLGCTFNTELVGELYEMTGRELRLNKIDSLLGPGMNIHRNPLNGRNFEYISEDPLLTGRICAAQVKAMAKSEIGSTIKHFCGNNQEVGRSTSDSVMSERCLREIYLKGFEIAVKEGGARSVMTTYRSVNGLWTAGSYDLCTTILRKEWGFDGAIMSDWNTTVPEDGSVPWKCVAAGNDIIMPGNPDDDKNIRQAYKEGKLTEEEIRNCAGHLVSMIRRLERTDC